MPPPGHLAAVGVNEAGGARGGHRPSPALVVGMRTCADVVVVGLCMSVR